MFTRWLHPSRSIRVTQWFRVAWLRTLSISKPHSAWKPSFLLALGLMYHHGFYMNITYKTVLMSCRMTTRVWKFMLLLQSVRKLECMKKERTHIVSSITSQEVKKERERVCVCETILEPTKDFPTRVFVYACVHIQTLNNFVVLCLFSVCFF